MFFGNVEPAFLKAADLEQGTKSLDYRIQAGK